MSEQPRPRKRGFRDAVADVFDLLGALIQAVIVGVGALLIVVALLHGVTGWILNLLGLD